MEAGGGGWGAVLVAGRGGERHGVCCGPHQSTAKLWPRHAITSGAVYSGVPHSVQVRSAAEERCAASPKSTSLR